jgi:hypothetical protein
MSPKAKSQLARERLERALPAVAVEDYTEAVTWLFASLEATVAALAAQHGVSIEPKHWKKAEVAEQLFAQGAVSTDFAPALRALNNARKKAIYEGEEPDLGDRSLEDLAAEIEAAVELVEIGASSQIDALAKRDATSSVNSSSKRDTPSQEDAS